MNFQIVRVDAAQPSGVMGLDNTDRDEEGDDIDIEDGLEDDGNDENDKADADSEEADNAAVIVDGTPVGGLVPAVSGGTPIPGLRVEIHEEIATTPIAIHEVITDELGRPSTPIVVDSESEITILSQDETIARFQASGPASEFAAPAQPTIVATPMIEPIGACLNVVAGTPIVQLNYNNLNEDAVDANVPITGLHPDLYRTPEVTTDDLLLNDMQYSNSTKVIPGDTYRGLTPNENAQTFINGENSFIVPFDSTLGPLTWSFIGKQTVIDGSTAQCEAGGVIEYRCEELSPEKIRMLNMNLRRSVSGTLKAAARVMRIGSSPYLKTSAPAIKNMRKRAKALIGALICPPQAILAPGCVRQPFPFEELMKLHQGIFKKKSPVKPKMFEKLKKAYNRGYQNFLYTTFPTEIVFCPGAGQGAATQQPKPKKKNRNRR